ncbi:hypothetical protein GCM10029976_007970 [Kribbella albertanoniae]
MQRFRAGPERTHAQPGHWGLVLMQESELLGRGEPIHQVRHSLGHGALRIAEQVV